MIVINLQNQPSYSSYINLPDKLLSHHIEMTMGPGLGPEDFSFELWFNCKTPTPTLYPWQIKQLKSNLGGGSGEKIYIFLFLIRKIRQKHWHSLGFIEGLVGWRCEMRLRSKRGLSRLFMSCRENHDKTKVCTALSTCQSSNGELEGWKKMIRVQQYRRCSLNEAIF